MIEDKEREGERRGEKEEEKNISCEVVIFRLHGATT
jgi:hypothetical protein